jgi:hypothetical protein
MKLLSGRAWTKLDLASAFPTFVARRRTGTNLPMLFFEARFGAAHEIVADVIFRARSAAQSETGIVMAKKVKKRVRREYTRDDVKELRAHSKARTPVTKIAKRMKRTEASLRQKAINLGIGLGHRR